jgi:hypothetical protein
MNVRRGKMEDISMKSKRDVKARIRFNKILIVLTSICFIAAAFGLLKNMYHGVAAAFHHTDTEWMDISRDMTGGIPRLYQTDSRWKKKIYGTNVMEINGCGPTCLSMVYCGMTGDAKWNPYAVAKMAEEKGYYVSGVGTSWELMTDGAKRLGLKAEQVVFSENAIRETLKSGQPIICAMGPGDFTTEGHFIVLTGVKEDGRIIVNDPNSKELSEKFWELERLMGQIKNLWKYKK